MNYIYTHSTEFPEKHFNYGLSNNQCCITNFLNSELLSPLKWTTRQHMNRLQYGSIIIVLHVTQILHSNIRSYPWSMLQAVVSLNWSCFLCKYARTRHIRSLNHVCVCVSVTPFPHFNLWTNEWLSRSLVSPNGDHLTSCIHMTSTNNMADMLNLWHGNQN